MTMKFVHDGRELAAAELDKVSGGRDFESRMKDLESQDKLGNFEIQDLMSRFNQTRPIRASSAK